MFRFVWRCLPYLALPTICAGRSCTVLFANALSVLCLPGGWVTESACRFIYNAERYWFIRHYWRRVCQWWNFSFSWVINLVTPCRLTFFDPFLHRLFYNGIFRTSDFYNGKWAIFLRKNNTF